MTLFMPIRDSPMTRFITRWLKNPMIINTNWETRLNKLFRNIFFKRIL